MASSSRSDSSQKALEGDLIGTGKKLLEFPSTDDLLILLEKAESLLAKVRQRPPKSTCHALVPTMEALMSEQLLCHDDVNVQVAVASCFSEIAKITCPQKPYNNAELKGFFKLVMIAFRQLTCESSQNYSRALHTLEMMAKVRSTQLMLDKDADELILEMFQLFISNINFSYPSDISGYMEAIMTAVIKEGDISFELLSVLLASVKMENKNTSPSSWELGKKVFENCATKLQSCLWKAVKEMNLDVADYAEIVASICYDTSNVENMVSKEVVTPTKDGGASQLDGLSNTVSECPDGQTNDGNEAKLNGENSSEALNRCPSIVQPGTNTAARRSGRCRKPNSVLRPEEGYQFVWTLKGKCTGEASSSDDHNKEKNDSASASELGNAKKKGKRTVAEMSDIRLEKEGGMLSDTSSEGEFETSLQEQHEGKEMISCEHEDVAHEIEELPMTKPAQAKYTMDDKEMMEKFPMSKRAKAQHPMKDKEKSSTFSELWQRLAFFAWTRARQSRRCRKPNSVLRPEEGYQYVWTLKGKYTGNAQINNSSSVSELGNAKKKGEKVIAETSDFRLEKEEGILSDTSSDGKSEMSLREQHERNEIISQGHEDVAHEMEELPMPEPAQAKHIMKDKKKMEIFSMSTCAKAKHPMKDEEKVLKEVVTPTTGGRASQIDGLSKDVHEYQDGQANDVARRSRRCRKPNSVLRPEEGYQYIWTLKCKYTGEASSESRAIAESSDIRLEKGKGILSDTFSDGESELLPREQHDRNGIISWEHEGVVHEMEEFRTKLAQAEHKTKDKEKKSKRSQVDCGEELINSRIQVWWPLDKMFYVGTVRAFDLDTKMHTILYDDDDVEILNLRKETWELLTNEQPPQQSGFVLLTQSGQRKIQQNGEQYHQRKNMMRHHLKDKKVKSTALSNFCT
ncbi:sister chromatid cohesion protein pds5 homolog a [Phtheirospermum japonicum]|uniref:Sister chromatid cohesion protein pds5 homolog a n=1 Tax=Phtheirospermum japonicum TaxID=374723 RepID=A0A830B6U7_9LAMI|nr:sister chromatid cohesion protein pds5 homolog a [Phtheirospermum japonicum]